MPVEAPQSTNIPPQASPIITALAEDHANAAQLEATALLGTLIQNDQYVGEIWSINYETPVVQIHDLHRQRVGGIPNQCFLIATRIAPGNTIDYTLEDSSIVLLRVLNAASLPGDEKRTGFVRKLLSGRRAATFTGMIKRSWTHTRQTFSRLLASSAG
jgi:hypothetical protein